MAFASDDNIIFDSVITCEKLADPYLLHCSDLGDNNKSFLIPCLQHERIVVVKRFSILRPIVWVGINEKIKCLNT